MLNNLFRSIRSLVLITLLSLANQSVLAEDEQAVSLIDKLHETLLNNMQDASELGYQGRYDNIAPFIQENFDFPIIAKVILSRYWKDLSDDQKNQFIDSLSRLTIGTYASRFNAYNEERFETGQLESLKKGRKLIKTKIYSNNEEETSLDYLVHQRDGHWYIISVIANGVNDLSLKRAEYSAVIKEQGFEQLLQVIGQKISDLDKS